MSETLAKRRYARIYELTSGKPRRVLIALRDGVEGFWTRTWEYCPNCSEYGDFGELHGPYGCRECGHTGRRRVREFEPLEWSRFEYCGKAKR